MKPIKYKYAILAKNTIGVHYYCILNMFGEFRMIQLANDTAITYVMKRDAVARMEYMKGQYKGLKDWRIEYRKVK